MRLPGLARLIKALTVDRGLAIVVIVMLAVAEGIVVFSGTHMRASVREAQEVVYFTQIQEAAAELSGSSRAKADMARGFGGTLALEQLTVDITRANDEIQGAVDALESLKGGDEPEALASLEAQLGEVRHVVAGIVVGAFTPEFLEAQLMELDAALDGLAASTSDMIEDEQAQILAGSLTLERIRKLVELVLPVVLLGGFGVLLALFGLSRRLASAEVVRDRSRARACLLESVTHEIRTPLSVIVGLSSELSARVGSFSDAEVASFSRLLLQQSWTVSDKVESAAISARRGGELSVVSQEADLRMEAENAATTMEPDYVLPIEGHASACGDRERIRFILRNLIGNALRYGGPSTHLVIAERDGMATVDVIDNGSMVAGGVFGETEASAGNDGSPRPLGLDLEVCRRLARKMGGDLFYVREAARNRFTLALPLIVDDTSVSPLRQTSQNDRNTRWEQSRPSESKAAQSPSVSQVSR